MASDWLCTLAEVQREIKDRNGSDQFDNNWIIDNIPLVSARINVKSRLRFVPYYEEYVYDAFGPHIDDTYRKIDIARPLLYPTQVINALKATLVLGVDYTTIPQDGPAFQLQMINNTFYGWSYGFGWGSWLYLAPIQWLRAIKVTGIWGYRTFYPQEGWVGSGVTITSDIDDHQRSFTVSNVSGYDDNAQSPAISVGNVIQVGDNTTAQAWEWMQVVAVTNNGIPANDTVTVVRGLNGSTRQAWTATTPVSTWSVQPEIKRAAVRWCGYWYSRRGAYEAVKSDFASGKTLVYPSDAPSEIDNIIDQTSDWRWGTA